MRNNFGSNLVEFFFFFLVASHCKIANGRSRSDEENLNPFCGNGVVESSK